jgi:DNA-3-methyladenine glycosylase II
MSQEKLARHFETVDPVMAAIIALAGPCTLGTSSRASVFESLARSIASQQLSGVVAGRILERLVTLHDGSFPTPAQLIAADPVALRSVGFSFAKIAALKDLAAKTLDGTLPSDAALADLEDEAVIERCISVRGIGRWTAEMLLMSHLQRPDVLPVAAFGERWRPYRSAAAWYLWRAVDLHREARLPKRNGRAPRVDIIAAKVA